MRLFFGGSAGIAQAVASGDRGLDGGGGAVCRAMRVSGR